MFEIHPLPDGLAKQYETAKNNIPHLVMKKSISDNQSYFDDSINGNPLLYIF